MAELYLRRTIDSSGEDTNAQRWARHYELRLTYERAMLEAEGGAASNADMEPGGWIKPRRRDVQFGHAHVDAEGWAQILSVHKSPTTGRVTSVRVLGDNRYLNDRAVKPRLINVERLGEDAYRAPTAEERAQFAETQKEAKRIAKANAKPTIPLINPTEDDARHLQTILNDRAERRHNARPEAKYLKAYERTEIVIMTQAEYSARSKGAYSSHETRTLHNAGGIIGRRSSNMYSGEGSKYDKELGPAVAKIRAASSGGGCYGSPPHIIVISDKPKNRLPLDWLQLESVGLEAVEA